MSKSRAAVFLDRDGVITRVLLRDGKPYPPHSMGEFALLPRVADACTLLSKIGPLVVVTNQPDVGRGKLDIRVVEEMHEELGRLLPIDRIEVCYEDGRDLNSLYYKPAPGMLKRAAAEMNLDLSSSIMIGDRWRDISCGHAAGCLTVWIDSGYAEQRPDSPDHTVSNLMEAAELLQQIGRIPQEH